MIRDFFTIALDGLKHRKLRTWLTMLGIFVGVASIVALISIGDGMQTALTEQFKKIGTNRIIITPGGTFIGPMGEALSTAKLTEDDVNLIETVRGVERAGGVITRTIKIEFKKQVKHATVLGIPTDSKAVKLIEDVGFFDIKEGRQIKDPDRYKANLGHFIAYDAFDDSINLNDKIYIDDRAFNIAGIQEKVGVGMYDRMVRIPKDTLKEISDIGDEVSMVFAVALPGYTAAEVAENIKKKLRKDRGLEEGEEDFSVETAENAIKSVLNIMGIVQLVVISLASISLLVGGVGIMNTMFTSVMERTRDIGIMKAVGAKNKDILSLFLIESGLLGMTGGVIGITIGSILSLIVEFIAQNVFDVYILRAAITPTLIFGALFFSFAVGCISGFIPARDAAKLSPVKAFRMR